MTTGKFDAIIVEGVYHRDQDMGYKLYEMCRDYYNKSRGVFIVDEESKKDIFQNSLITLLEIINKKKIFVENGVLKGSNGKPLSCKLTTYFMGIAKLKYREWVSEHPIGLHIYPESGLFRKNVSDEDLYREILYGGNDNDDMMSSIIEDCISHMSERCNQILTLFYYEERTLDEIMAETHTYNSKDALKTEKYKCMKNLRESANEIYYRFCK